MTRTRAASAQARGGRAASTARSIASLVVAGSLLIACGPGPEEDAAPVAGSPDRWERLHFRWLVDPETDLALGIAEGGPLGDYQHKIHLALGDPPKFQPAEFFCDPDDVIAVWGPDGADVAYMPYLVWDRAVDEAARSVTSVYSGGGLKPFGTGRAPRLEMHVTHRLSGGRVATTVEIVSRYAAPVDVVYVYQDAAVHWLSLPGQKRVGSLASFDGAILPDRYVFRPAGDRDFVLTHHRDHGVAGGIATSGSDTWLAVLPAYAFFGAHVNGPRPPGRLGFADVAAPPGADALLEALAAQAGESFPPEGRKVRLVLFRARSLPPGAGAVFRFWRFGLTSPAPLEPGEWGARVATLMDESAPLSPTPGPEAGPGSAR